MSEAPSSNNSSTSNPPSSLGAWAAVALATAVLALSGCETNLEQLVLQDGAYVDARTGHPHTGHVYLIEAGTGAHRKTLLRLEGYLKNGKQEREWTIRKHTNGQLVLDLDFEGGVLQGEVNTYHENLKKKHSLNFKNGEMHGVQTEWLSTGEIFKQGNYRDGLYHGPQAIWAYLNCASYYLHGQLTDIVTFHDQFDILDSPGLYSSESMGLDAPYRPCSESSRMVHYFPPIDRLQVF